MKKMWNIITNLLLYGLTIELLVNYFSCSISSSLFPLPHLQFQLLTPSTVAVWLSACLALDFDPLPVQLVLIKCLCMSLAFSIDFCGSFEFMIMINTLMTR